MIIYNTGTIMKQERVKQAESILNSIPFKQCFITGSFLYKETYNDIDVFVVSRSKKKFTPKNKKIDLQFIDTNDLYSLFFHSISKCCVSKNILLKKQIRTTIANYWNVVNETLPDVSNEPENIRKNVKQLILFTEYFKTGRILDTRELREHAKKFKDKKQVVEYIKINFPLSVKNKASINYLKRFFYTYAGFYKEALEYKGQREMYHLSHNVLHGVLKNG